MFAIAVVSVVLLAPQEGRLLRQFPRIEAENMKVVGTFGGPSSVQDMAPFSGRWGGGKQLLWQVQGKFFNSRMTLSFHPPAKGRFVPVLYFTMAPDYGTFSFYWNDDRLVILDSWSENVTPTRVELPHVTLGDEDVVIKIDSFNYDERSKTKGLMVGLDRIEFVPAPLQRRSFNTDVENGICSKGGAHTAKVEDSYMLPSIPYGIWMFRWCSGCGGVFTRFSGGELFGGSCHVPSEKIATNFGYSHLGYLSPDKLLPFADPQAKGPHFYWCANCKAIYKEGIKPPIGTDGCAKGNSPADSSHIPYKNDTFAITKADRATGKYQICKRCGLLFSLKDMFEHLEPNNSAIASSCVTYYPKVGPHEPIPDEYYNIQPAWPASVGYAWKDLMWAKCIKCKSLYCLEFMPGNTGNCAAGGPHVPDTRRLFPLVHQPTVDKPYWFECYKCGGLFYGNQQTSGGSCVKGGSHELFTPYKPGDQNQVMVKNSEPGGQAGWHVCEKCGLLFSAR